MCGSRILYDLGFIEGTLKSDNETELLKELGKMGLPVSQTKLCKKKDLLSTYNDFLNRRKDLPYDIDGTVIKVNDYTFSEELARSFYLIFSHSISDY